MLFFWIMFTSDDQPGWLMDSNPIHHPSPAKTVKCSFLYYIQHLMLARLVNGLEPHPPPLPSQKMKCSFLGYVYLLMISRAVRWTQTPSVTPPQPKKWNAHFWIMFTSDEQPGWSMDSNPICHPSPDKKMKCSYFDYVQLLMIGQAGQWTWTPSTTPLQPKKMKCSFLDYVHFWWSAWLIDELEPHLPPLSYQKNEMLNFWLHSTSDDQPSWSIDSKSICQPSPANKMKCFFLDYVHFWWSARLVDGLKPHLPPLSSQKNEMLTFGLCSFWMISQAGQWTQTPSSTSLQHFGWSARLVNGLKPHPPPLSKTVKCSFLYYIQHLMLARLVNGFEPHPPPLSSQKNKMLIFWLYSTSDDQLGWSMDLNPICQPSPANKMKCYFLDYVQLLMLARLVNGLKPHPSPLSSQRNEILILWSCSTSHDQLGWSVDSNPIYYPSPAKQMKCSFFDPVKLLMISCTGQWT